MQLKTCPKSKIKPGIRVLMRADLNVPLENGRVIKNPGNRIALIVPEIQALQKKGAKVILLSHLGRPKGKRVTTLSLRPVARRLAKELKTPVQFSEAIFGPEVESKIERLKNGGVLLLENLRFNPGEEKNESKFARELARLGDLYLNNAFATCHRKHASVVAITKYLPSYAGELTQREVKELSVEFSQPFVVLLGGAKLETKIDLLDKLAPKARAVLLGGRIAVGVLSAREKKNFMLQRRQLETCEIKLAQKVYKKYCNKLLLPIDLRVGTAKAPKKLKNKLVQKLSSEDLVFDIGPETVEVFRRAMLGAKSIVWNGPMGYIEKSFGQTGTKEMAAILAQALETRTVIGGGETVAFAQSLKLKGEFDFISSGGGAMLAFLAGKTMPGLKAITK